MLNFRKFVAENPERTERVVSRVEIVGLLLTMAAVVMITKKMPSGSTLLIIGLSMLAWVYFFIGMVSREFFSLNENSFFAGSLRISYTALAITMLGILFLFMRWHGGLMMINVGCAITGVMFIYSFYKMYFSKSEDQYKRTIINNLIVRMLPALLVAAFLIAIYFKS